MTAKAKAPDPIGADELLRSYIEKIEVMPVEDITPADYNPREELVPGDPDFEALQRSIEEFDQLEPLVWNRATKRLVGGHQRLAVIKHLGRAHAVVFVIETEDEDRERALNLALNKAVGRWDPVKLMAMVDEMSPDAIRLGGFSSTDEAYELMRAVEAGESTNFLDDIVSGRDVVGGGGGGGAAGELGESAGAEPAGEPRERKREIDLKEDHAHRTGPQYFDVILQLTAEQRAIFYQAIGRAKKAASTDNTFEAVVFVMDQFNKKWDQDNPSETALEPETLE